MRVAWFSSGCSSFVAAYYGEPDRIVYIDVANQHPDSMRFLRDAERFLGREIGHSCIKGVFLDELDPNREKHEDRGYAVVWFCVRSD